MKKRYPSIALILAYLLSSNFVFGAEAKKDVRPAASVKAEKPKDKARAEMTKAEILAAIKDAIDSEPEVLDFVKDVKKKKDEAGKDFYVVISGSKEIKLEDLGRESLNKILTSVNQTAVRIRTERIQRQLETIRQAQNIQRMQQIQSIQNVQRVQQTTVSPPAMPPSVPPQLPRIPQPPPASPKK